jgi:uncharacterized protein (DUF1501 family)
MPFIDPVKHARRAFLKRAGALSLQGAALPLALNLAGIGEAAAFDSSDYKALVCIFLQGGNDYANTLVAYDDPSYNLYSTIRGGGAGQTAGGLALAKSALTGTLLTPTIALPDGRQYALNPAMPEMARLINSGVGAVQLNVGPLVVPLTKTQYLSSDRRTYPLPPKLFSHNDQVSEWQSSSPEGSTRGWGGKLGDLALSSNANSLFTCISATGNAVFLSGDTALQYQISTSGAVAIAAIQNRSSAVANTLQNLISQNRADMFQNEYNRVTARAISAQGAITAALAGVTLKTVFPGANTLADQLKIVARLIASRGVLGNRRQVFMVSLGGFDNHDALMTAHPLLLAKLSAAVSSFYDATVELGVADKVTAFTASDFGRTLQSNGSGADHGWGSHHFMFGGAVKGKAFYGIPPPVSVGSTSAPQDQWHTGQGRLLPTTSVDQYAATLAQWFGAADFELAGILPNLRHFGAAAGRTDYPANMGFMA